LRGAVVAAAHDVDGVANRDVAYSIGEEPPSLQIPTPETWSSGLEAIKFRYLVGEQWQDSFDSLAAGSLPRAIEVQAWFTSTSASAGAGPAGSDDPEMVRRAPDRRRLIVVDGRMPEGVAAAASAGSAP